LEGVEELFRPENTEQEKFVERSEFIVVSTRKISSMRVITGNPVLPGFEVLLNRVN